MLPWCVDDKDKAVELVSKKVFGIITNFPETLIKLIFSVLNYQRIKVNFCILINDSFSLSSIVSFIAIN